MNMIEWIIIAIIVLALGLAGFKIWRRFFRPLPVKRFQQKWVELQKQLADKEQWPTAVINADKLLDDALKKKHFGGRTMGERMVKAQRLFTDNDSVWFGHKLRNKIEDDPNAKLKEADVKGALLGIRQALKDLGALPSKPRSSEND